RFPFYGFDPIPLIFVGSIPSDYGVRNRLPFVSRITGRADHQTNASISYVFLLAHRNLSQQTRNRLKHRMLGTPSGLTSSPAPSSPPSSDRRRKSNRPAL